MGRHGKFLRRDYVSPIDQQPLYRKPTMTLTPPIAEQRPHSFEHHGVRIEDPYHWLRDPGYPDVKDKDVLAYLEGRERLFRERDGPKPAAHRDLFQEMKGRMKEDDRSVPNQER
jgi:oligopeptidase B